MQNNLRGLLDEIAADARPAAPDPELWRRGVRRHRARRATAAVAAVVAVVGLASASVLRPDVDRTTPVVAPTTRLAIPDRIYDVPRWTPGTEDAGPPGPLAALLPGFDRPRGWGSSDAPVGISAVDGSYRFIDLPGSAARADSGPVLSPDGGSVAYALHGEPSTSAAGSDVVGLAVYDAVTGEVRRREIMTELGVWVHEILWSPDSRHVAVAYSQYTGIGKGQGEPALVWDVESGRSHELDADDVGGARDSRGVPAVGRDGLVRTYDPASGRVVREVLLDPSISGISTSLMPSLVAFGFGRVVWFGSNNSALNVAPAPRGLGESATGRLVLSRSDEYSSARGLYGWVDDHTVLMTDLTMPRRTVRHSVFRIDVDSGTKTLAIRCNCTPQLATDLITQPFTPGVRPDSPRDPRPFVIGGGIAALFGGLVLVVLLVRSRRWS